MKVLKEIGRKACPRCGAHRIMKSPAQSKCPVCGNPLQSVPAIEKQQGIFSREWLWNRSSI